MSLSSILPLRKTSVWGSFENVKTIPHGYGRISSQPIPYNDSLTKFVWLDGVNGGVDSLTVDGQEYQTFDWYNGVDDTGTRCTFIETNTPIDKEMIATGRGKISAVTGDLITNPADIVGDVLSIAGAFIPDLGLFKSECAKRGLFLHGVIDEDRTARGHLEYILQSVSVIWSGALAGFAQFYPDAITAPTLHEIETKDAASASYQLDDIYTVVRVLYAYDWGHQKHRKVLQYSANVETYGERILEIEADWLPNESQANKLALRLINWNSRPRWKVSATKLGSIYAGDVVDVQSSKLPITGTAAVKESSIDLIAGKTSIQFEMPVGPVPPATLQRLATAFDTNPNFELVRRAGDKVIFTILDDGEDPLANAEVQLDSGLIVITDGAGQAIFPDYLLIPGTEHKLFVNHADFEPSTIIVTV